MKCTTFWVLLKCKELVSAIISFQRLNKDYTIIVIMKCAQWQKKNEKHSSRALHSQRES